MSNTSYILNQKINNIRSFIDNESDHIENIVLRSDLEANNYRIVNVSNLQTHHLEANGYIGSHYTLENIFISTGISDGEDQTYQWGQRYIALKPSFPESWAISLRNICLHCKVNSYLALRVIPTSNTTTVTYVRKECLTLNDPIKIENSHLIRLSSQKLKANTSMRVKVEGCRLLKDTVNHTYGKTKLQICVWGTSMDDEEIYNEITAYLDTEIDEVETEYSVEIYSMAQFSTAGTAWVYENGFF